MHTTQHYINARHSTLHQCTPLNITSMHATQHFINAHHSTLHQRTPLNITSMHTTQHYINAHHSILQHAHAMESKLDLEAKLDLHFFLCNFTFCPAERGAFAFAPFLPPSVPPLLITPLGLGECRRFLE